MIPTARILREIDADKAREDAVRSLKEIGAEGGAPDWWDRVQLWILRHILETAGSMKDAPILWTFGAIILLVVLFFVLRQRWRFSAKGQNKTSEFAGSAGLSLAELEERARKAEYDQDHHEAVLWWFRTTAKLAAERKVVGDLRGMTATEVATAIGLKFPSAAASCQRAADVFNQTMYGHGDAQSTDVDTVRNAHQTVNELTATHKEVKLSS